MALLWHNQYRTQVLEHLPGLANVSADTLSRLAQPGASKRVPAHLASVKRTSHAVFDRSMFRAIGFTPATLYRAMDGP